MSAGKSGVGKTTYAGATALHYASLGEATLVILTNPTPSLSHIFETQDKQKPAKLLEGLYLAELGMEKEETKLSAIEYIVKDLEAGQKL